MRLFVICKSTGKKVYFVGDYPPSKEFYIECPWCGSTHNYTLKDVQAENEYGGYYIVVSTVIGGLIGLFLYPLIGPFGVLIGGLIGWFLALKQKDDDDLKIRKFYNFKRIYGESKEVDVKWEK